MKKYGKLSSSTHAFFCFAMFASALLCLFLSGCGGGGNKTSPPPPASATLTLSVSSVEFGIQPVQTAVSGSIAASNSGSATLSISNIQITGAQSGDFKLASTSLPISVAPGNSVTFQFSFTPSVVGARSASVSFTSNATNVVPAVTLSGTGWNQAASASIVLSPNANQDSNPVTVDIAGDSTSFLQGVSKADFGPGILVATNKTDGSAPVTVNSPTDANVQIQVQSAAAGPRQVTVSTNGRTSTATFFIKAVNGGPQANAGLQQFVPIGSTVHLNGSGTTVPISGATGAARSAAAQSAAGTSLTYEWSFLSVPNGSAAAFSDHAAIDPTFVADKSGDYVVKLSVSDGTSSTYSSVKASTAGVGPAANAGVDQFVAVGSKIQLDGSKSFDAQGKALTYVWAFISKPNGSAATLSDNHAVAPTLVADLAGTYVLQLTVNDGQGNNASAQVTISTEQVPPIADAGPDQSVSTGSTVQLDGSSSVSPMGDTLSFLWNFTYKPSGSVAALSNGTIANPTFTADISGTYALQVAVSDTHGNTSLATVLITTGSIPPVAVAGPGQKVDVGTTVQLDGSQSSSGNGTVSYQWVLLNVPVGSQAILSVTNKPNPTFVADVPGFYVAQLVVSDGVLTSVPSTVLITAGVPDLTADPASLNVGDQLLKTTSHSVSIVITSSGVTNLTIAGFTISGANASEFAFTSAAVPISLAPGQQTTVNVTFTPVALGSRSAVLNISDNTPAKTHTVNLVGTGTAPAVAFNPSTLAFANQAVGTAGTQGLAINNTGTGDLNISNIGIAGANAADFSFTAGALPITVAAGASTMVQVTFKPAATGSRSAALSVTNNADGSPHLVSLTGTGVQPAVTLSVSSLTFGNQLVNTTSSAQTFTITNSGTADLNISKIGLSGTNASVFAFTTASQLPITVAAGASTSVNVTFAPAAQGNQSATLSITSNAPGSPHTVSLTGTGVQPILTLSAGSISFPDSQVGQVSAAQSLTLSNTGTADLAVSVLTIAGTNASDFAFSPAIPTLPLTIAAGKSTVVNMVFNPTGGGSRMATMTITSNAGAAQSVSLSGTGLIPNVAITPSNGILSFGSVRVGSTSGVLTVTVANTGTASLTISGIVLSGGNSADFSFTSSTLPITIDAGKQAIINATFRPTTTGARSATMTITHNALGGSTTITLNGTGTAPDINVTPSPLFDFGNVLVGSTSPAQVFTIKNTGTADLNVSAIALGNTANSEFTMVAPSTPLIITPGSTNTLSVTLKPSQTGLRSGTITITSDAGTSPTTVVVQGTGVAPVVSLAPTSLQFESLVNQPLTKPITVTNTGTADLSISQITVTGTNAAAFTFASGALPITVAAGNSTTVNVTFTPTARTSYSASLSFTDNAGNSPQSVALSGTGTSPGYSPSATSFDFGTQNVGTTSTPQQLVITNNGNANLVITNLQLAGTNPGDFAFTAGTLPITVTPNQTTSINLTFIPTAEMARSATLQITDNADSSPQSVALTGTGIQPKAVPSPTSLSFGNQLEHTASTAATITVTNTGSAALVITAVSISGTNAGDFAFTAGTFPITVDPTKNTTIPVTFTPSGIGARTATLNIIDNAADSPQSVGLSGTGIGPGFSPNPSTLAFASQAVNTTSAAKTITINNIGTANLVISSMSLTGTNAADFAYTAVLPITVAAGQSSSVSVTFTPSGTSNSTSRSASLQFTDNADGSPHSVPLTGTTSITNTLSMPDVTVGQNLEFQASAITSSPASSDLSVTITSADPSMVLLSTDPTLGGSASITITIPQGSNFAPQGFYVQALASSGTVQLSLVAPGSSYTPGIVNLTPAAAVIVSPGGVGVDFTSGVASDTSLAIKMNRLNADLSPVTGPNSEQKLRGGLSENITISSSDTTVGSIIGSPLTIVAGTSNATFSFHPVGPGTTKITVTQPPQFSTPTVGGSVNATVSGPKVLLNPATVGANLEVRGVAALDTAAPSGGLTVTISSNNSNVLLSTDPTLGGSSTIQLSVPGGSTFVPAFYVQALAGSGSAVLTGSAPGYGSATANVLMTPSAFLLAGPTGTPGQAFSTTTISADSTLTLSAWRLDSSNNPLQSGTIRGGFSVSVGVTSGTPATGTVVGTVATFQGGDSSNTSLSFHPLADGSSVLSVSPPAGFSMPTTNGSVTATVTAPAVSINVANSVIGANLQVQASGALNTAAPTALTVTVTSNNSAVQLATSATAAGSSSINLAINAGQGLQGKGFPAFYVQGLQASGGATLTVSVTSQSGWTSSSIPVTLAPSGFVLASPNGVGMDFGTSVGQSNTALSVRSAQLDPSTHAVANYQALRGGASASIPVNSQNTAVGTIVGSPLTFNGGDSSNTVMFAPISTGSTLLTVQPPAGFTSPASGASLTANVN
jgi:hypothetical protein